MKRKKLRGIAAVVAVLIAVLPCAAVPVFAHPVPAYEYGITGSGVFTRDKNSVLAVESEKLIFDIKDFPEKSYDISTEYKSTITAEYKFVNTSNQTVHTSMVFPVGNTSRYVNEPIYNFTPVITVDGEQIEAQVRHTYGGYAQYRNYADGVDEILDGWYEDDFYKPDTPVTAYSVMIDTSGYDDTLRVRGKVQYGNNTGYLAPGYYDGNIELFYYQNDTTQEKKIYVLGDSSDFYVEWQVEQQHYSNRFGPWYTQIDLPVEVTQVKNKDGTPFETTLKDLILSKRQEGSVVCEQDYYNAIAINFLDISDGSSRMDYVDDDQFCLWYTYDVEVEPYGSFVNAVTVPVYPTVQYGYDPYVYEYEYDLSPAKGWEDFGKLEIEVKSDCYIISGALLEGAEYSDGSYKVTLDGLPDGELSFRLCSVEEPEYARRGTSWMTVGIVLFVGLAVFIGAPLIAGITVLIVYLCVRKKKQNFESK